MLLICFDVARVSRIKEHVLSSIESRSASDTRCVLCVPGGRLPTCVCHWTLTTAFIGHRHMPSAANQHTFGDHSFAAAGTRVWNSLPTQLRESTRNYTRTISTSTQNASIWSLTAAAPSDCFFRALCINWLTYLLSCRKYVTRLKTAVKIRAVRVRERRPL